MSMGPKQPGFEKLFEEQQERESAQKLIEQITDTGVDRLAKAAEKVESAKPKKSVRRIKAEPVKPGSRVLREQRERRRSS